MASPATTTVATGATQNPPGTQPPVSQIQLPPHAPTLTSPTKEVNTASLCRLGQESVHDIVLKASEIFILLKSIQWPTGVSPTQLQAYQDSKAKLDENIKQMTMHFRRLRIIYLKVYETTAGLDSRHVEELLPIEVNGELKGEGPKVTDTVKYASEEHKEVIGQLQVRNRELKDIIDKLRMTVWEINTMIATRKS